MQTPTVVFVLSCTRSGSTWVGYVLASCADSAFLGEYYRAWNPALKQPCAWCASEGLESCSVLGGIESVPVEQAFPFAFDRTGASVLIDVSKSIEWASRQIEANPSFNFKLIHLIRDPRGWYASEHRRSPLSMDALLDRWVSENRDIEQFLKRSRIPSYSVFYDQLAANPESEFYPLCDFLGLRFHPQALQYWKLAHHGFSANGASSFLLKGKAKKADKTGLLADIMITGDDRYYEAHQCSSFFDERWKTTLTAEEIEAITNRADVQAVLANYEHSLSADGVEELELAVR